MMNFNKNGEVIWPNKKTFELYNEFESMIADFISNYNSDDYNSGLSKTKNLRNHLSMNFIDLGFDKVFSTETTKYHIMNLNDADLSYIWNVINNKANIVLMKDSMNKLQTRFQEINLDTCYHLIVKPGSLLYVGKVTEDKEIVYIKYEDSTRTQVCEEFSLKDYDSLPTHIDEKEMWKFRAKRAEYMYLFDKSLLSQFKCDISVDFICDSRFEFIEGHSNE